jgi:prepilin-type N-terminal cleavage/methylation domain-containing protein
MLHGGRCRLHGVGRHIDGRHFMAMHRHAAGFSLMELAVSIAIVAVLATALISRVLFYQEDVERLAVAQVVTALRSGLRYQLVSLITRGRMRDAPTLAEQNPMDWLSKKPVNYLGDFYAPQEADLSAGNWYFDRKNKKLVYLFSHNDNFDDGERNQLNFKVKLVNNSGNSSKQVEESGLRIYDGVILDQVVP